MDKATEERVLLAADQAEIRNVIARLAQLADIDTDDFTEYLSLWAPDGVTIHPTDTAHGRAEILSRSLDLRAQGVQGPGTDTQHVSTTQWVHVDGDVATSISYWLFYGQASQPSPQLRAMGSYQDTLTRSPDGWKLSRRQVSHGQLPPGRP
jgi:ketosteroid isomerase-like protein